MEKHTALTTWIVIFAIVSCICLGVGLYKMCIYRNADSFLSTQNVHEGYEKVTAQILGATNAYVGSDAYNYIINANYTTGFFVLSMFFGLTSVGLGIIKAIKSNK